MNKRMGCMAVIVLGVFSISARAQNTGTNWPSPQVVLQESPPLLSSSPGDDSDPVGLEEYLRRAEKNNPGLKAAYHKWRGALERAPQAASLEDPRLSYTEYLEKTMMPAEEIRVMQMVPYPGKLELRGRIESAEAEALRKEFEKARLDLRSEVKDAYYEYYYLEETVRINRENLDLLRRFESIAAARYEVGKGGNQDVLKAQVELGKMENEVRSLEDSRTPVRARLNALMNLPTEAEIPPPSQIDLERLDLDAQAVLALAYGANPEIQALDARLRKNRDQLALAKRNYYPDFTFGLGWMNSNRDLDPPPGDEYMAMVEINLPVYRKKLAAGVREADAGIREMESMKQEVQNRISVDLQDQLYKLRNAERQMHLYNDVLVPKSLQTVEVTETAYSAAGADFLDLVEAERELLMFQESYFRSVADYGQALAKIEALVGAVPISGGEPLVGESPKTSPRTSPLSEGENSALER